MSSIGLPEAGTSVIAARTRSLQVPVIVGPTNRFGETVNPSMTQLARNLNTRGMGHVRIQLVHYPNYAPTNYEPGSGVASAWVARNYLMFRIVGSAAPFKPPASYRFILGAAGDATTPLTPAMLLPVSVPVEIVLSASSFNTVWVEFDTTAGTPTVQQGYDIVLITATASAA